MNTISKTLLGAVLALASIAGAWAQAAAPVTVLAPWARASVQGQRASGAFMTLVAQEPLTLVGAASPVAGLAEVHEMKMEGDVMRMRPVAELKLEPNRPVQLKPGGHHLMLQELKAPLAANTRIPLTLSFKTSSGELRELALQVPVSAVPPREAGAADAHGHGHGKH
ncbi:copper chaperone PCu(A)C [Ramlibacter sp.]|uniref:copper chaperone PCu(A)C n=1 Tax=Ramlibacter sp. TaxID=1917967 RepID=UPI002FC8B526